MQEAYGPSEHLFSEEFEGWQAESCLLSSLPRSGARLKLSTLEVLCCVKTPGPGSSFSDSDLTSHLPGLEEPFKTDLHLVLFVHK